MISRRVFLKTTVLLAAASSLPGVVSGIVPARAGVSGRYAAVGSQS